MTRSPLGEQLRSVRLTNRRSQKLYASLLGTTRQRISELESVRSVLQRRALRNLKPPSQALLLAQLGWSEQLLAQQKLAAILTVELRERREASDFTLAELEYLLGGRLTAAELERFEEDEYGFADLAVLTEPAAATLFRSLGWMPWDFRAQDMQQLPADNEPYRRRLRRVHRARHDGRPTPTVPRWHRYRRR